ECMPVKEFKRFLAVHFLIFLCIGMVLGRFFAVLHIIKFLEFLFSILRIQSALIKSQLWKAPLTMFNI
ncbi:MAG TPA: hypothetical protein VGD26_07425, partial [Chitinophagaceae bacterium]